MSIDEMATELLDALDRNARLVPFTTRDPSFDNRTAYLVGAELLRRRRARGERTLGRKIGFTNRTIWEEYGVYTPMWAHVYDTTVTFFDGPSGSVKIGHLAEPRIEPEITLHFKESPAGAQSEAEILSCIDWIAHSVEIVQSHFPGWKFVAPDTAADFGLHGGLVVGPPKPVAELGDPADLIEVLRRFTIALSRDGAVQARGGGALVLDSPLLAFAHLQSVLREQPQFDPVQAGELVTTGTLTAALPIKPGETWSTAFQGVDLGGLTIRFE